jgi:hypothetical protein
VRAFVEMIAVCFDRGGIVAAIETHETSKQQAVPALATRPQRSPQGDQAFLSEPRRFLWRLHRNLNKIHNNL